MKHFTRPLLASFAATLMLAACESPTHREAAAPAVAHTDAACVITPAASAHIYARHCTASSGASQLLPAYCTNAGMQTFCNMVQNPANAASQTRVVQGDGRVRYDTNLGVVVGTNNEKCGRLIITSPVNGDVVTEFPELAGAPTPPAC